MLAVFTDQVVHDLAQFVLRPHDGRITQLGYAFTFYLLRGV